MYDTHGVLLLLYGSIFTSVLLVEVVWDKISGHTRRKASVRSGVCVVADSDAVLGSGDKKNPTFL